MSNVTIVMYHYVRKIENSKYPNIKGLEYEGFKRQLDYLQANYTIITAEQLIEFTRGENLPERACLLTFDDGYKDHIEFVFPELVERNLQGSFFPPVQPVVEGKVLDVNRIQFILACCSDQEGLAHSLDALCLEKGVLREDLNSYRNTYGVADRFDTKEVVYIKRMLQHVLPENLRNEITNLLFREFVSEDIADFAGELYLSTDDVKYLAASGMYVGSHGYRHLWLEKESEQSQSEEIDKSLNFLKDMGAPTNDWIMCYPYGSFNRTTLDLLRRKKCSIGLTTEVDTADLKAERFLELPRLDTNDFPQ